jgi:regulatory protein
MMPGKILALRLQRNGRKVTVEMEGAGSFLLAEPVAAGLHPGQILPSEEIDRLIRADRLEAMFRRCVALTARRPRSRAELERYIRGRKMGEEESGEVMRLLGERGLVDDQDFARQWVDNRQAFRPRSRRALRVELRKRGVSEQDAQEALDGVREGAAALSAAQGKAARLAKSVRESLHPRLEFEKKMTAFLASRGFDFDLSRETARTIWREFAATAERERENN